MLHTHEVTGSSPVVSTTIEDLCNGSTPDSDSVCGGSNPSSSAKTLENESFQGFFVFLFGGDNRTRTCDLMRVKHAL